MLTSKIPENRISKTDQAKMSGASQSSKKEKSNDSNIVFEDKRPEAIVQRKIQTMADLAGNKKNKNLTIGKKPFQSYAPENKVFNSPQEVVQRKLIPAVDGNFAITVGKLLEEPGEFLQKASHFKEAKEKARGLKKDDLLHMYYTALEYIRNSSTGNRILTTIENSPEKIEIIIGKEGIPDQYVKSEGKVYWNPLLFMTFWTNNGKVGMISPANTLLHELGHVYQYLSDKDGYESAHLETMKQPNAKIINQHNFENPSEGTSWLVEHHNLRTNEIPFSMEKGEPIRDRYLNAYSEFGGSPNEAPAKHKMQIALHAEQRAHNMKMGYWGHIVTHHDNNNNPPSTQGLEIMDEIGDRKLSELVENPKLLLSSIKRLLSKIPGEIDRCKTTPSAKRELNISLESILNFIMEIKKSPSHSFIRSELIPDKTYNQILGFLENSTQKLKQWQAI